MLLVFHMFAPHKHLLMFGTRGAVQCCRFDVDSMLKFNVSCAPLEQHDNIIHAQTVFKPALTATMTLRIHVMQCCGRRAVSYKALGPAFLV